MNPRNEWFGPATYVSMALSSALLVWGFVLPSTENETPGWVWLVILVVFVAVVVGLIVGTVYRRIAFGIVIACLSPVAVALALAAVSIVGKAVGAIF